MAHPHLDFGRGLCPEYNWPFDDVTSPPSRQTCQCPRVGRTRLVLRATCATYRPPSRYDYLLCNRFHLNCVYGQKVIRLNVNLIKWGIWWNGTWVAGMKALFDTLSRTMPDAFACSTSRLSGLLDMCNNSRDLFIFFISLWTRVSQGTGYNDAQGTIANN